MKCSLRRITDKKQAEDLALEVFMPDYPDMTPERFRKTALRYAEYPLSIGAYVEDKLVGVYLLSEKGYVNSPYGKNGIFGVALAILPEFQDRGIARAMIGYVMTLPYDYWWGISDKHLGKRDFWKKYRSEVLENDKYVVSIRKLELRRLKTFLKFAE